MKSFTQDEIPSTEDKLANTSAESSINLTLPAVKYDKQGRQHVDYSAIAKLVGPLFLNSVLQAILWLTDGWFIGQISVDAVAATAATFFLALAFVLLFGGIGLCVQMLVAQNYGAKRYADAAKAVWTGLYGALFMTPLFVAVALSGRSLLTPFHLSPQVEALALEYWFPRLMGGPFFVTLWAVSGFFNGIGRTKITLFVSFSMVMINAALNQLFIFHLGWGIAGSAWATTSSLFISTLITLSLFLHRAVREKFQSHLGWRFNFQAIRKLFMLGLPMGLLATVNLLGFSLFQLMQVDLGPIEGAATQVASMMTALIYEPGLGIALGATTLVGQSIGAGNKDWAMRIGTTTTMLAVGYMSLMGVVIAIAGPWLIPLFLAMNDPNTLAVIKLAATLLWITTAYQAFDGLYMGSAFSLRGAGDTKIPAIMMMFLSWLGFVPLTHMLTFAPGQGWVSFLPQFGYGAVGGWTAAVIYICLLGLLLFWRWRSGVWRKITVM